MSNKSDDKMTAGDKAAKTPITDVEVNAAEELETLAKLLDEEKQRRLAAQRKAAALSKELEGRGPSVEMPTSPGYFDPGVPGYVPPSFTPISPDGRRAIEQLQALAPLVKALNEVMFPAPAKRLQKDRRVMMGFDSEHSGAYGDIVDLGSVAPGETMLISSSPQVLFRGERLIIDRGDRFMVDDIKVGKSSQLVNARGVPGSAFVPDAAPFDLKMDTAQMSQEIVLVLRNITDKPVEKVRAVIFGTMVETIDSNELEIVPV